MFAQRDTCCVHSEDMKHVAESLVGWTHHMQYWKQETLDTDDKYDARHYGDGWGSEFSSQIDTYSQSVHKNRLPIIGHM